MAWPESPTGVSGDPGGTGPPGPQGPPGADSTVPGPAGPPGSTGATGAASTVPGPPGATGATGPPGSPGVGVWRGVWSSSTSYAVNDSVHRNGSAYVAIQAGTNQDPATQTAFWSLMAQKGDPGATGSTGATGATGATGPAGPQGPPGSGGGGGVESYLYLRGVAGNWATSANTSTLLQVTGNIDIRVRIALDNWAPGGSGYQTVLSKLPYATANGAGYQLVVSPAGLLLFQYSPTAAPTTVVSTFSSTAVSAGAGVAMWLRATRNASNGQVRFYTATDNSTIPGTGGWTALGANPADTPAGNIAIGFYPVEMGGQIEGSANMCKGRYYQAVICTTIADAATGAVFNANFATKPPETWTFRDLTNNENVIIHTPVGGEFTGTLPNPKVNWSFYVSPVFVDATQYSVGAGNPDNKDALSVAMSAAWNAGKTLQLPPGFLNYSGSWDCRYGNGVRIVGAGSLHTNLICFDTSSPGVPALRIKAGYHLLEGFRVGHGILQAASATGTAALQFDPFLPDNDHNVFESSFHDLRLSNSFTGLNSPGGSWSNSFENLIIQDFRGWGIVYASTSAGVTGSAFTNTYIQCNAAGHGDSWGDYSSGTGSHLMDVEQKYVDLSAGGGVFLKNSREMVFNQLNIEWGRYVNPLFMLHCNNVVINSLHLEGVRFVQQQAGDRFSAGISLTDDSRAVINGCEFLRCAIVKPGVHPTRDEGAGAGSVNVNGVATEYALFGFPSTNASNVLVVDGNGNPANDRSELEVHMFDEQLHDIDSAYGASPPTLRRVKAGARWLAGSGVHFYKSSGGGSGMFAGNNSIPAGRTPSARYTTVGGT